MIRPSVSLLDMDPDCHVSFETNQVLTNWSSNHTFHPTRIYEPQSSEEVAQVLQMCQNKNIHVRPIGSSLSPNGIGFGYKTNSPMVQYLISIAHIDGIQVNPQELTVTVGAGTRVSQVLSELQKHGLTLSNFSSIQEQQMGGWTQVSAHGTGCRLPPVDEMIQKMEIVTPSGSILSLPPNSNSNLHSYPSSIPLSHLFPMMKVGLGSLGVVTSLTLSCIPLLSLREQSFHLNRDQLSQQPSPSGSRSEILHHLNRLLHYRHVRYMWIPHSPSVIGVVSNPVHTSSSSTASSSSSSPSSVQFNVDLNDDQFFPFVPLLNEEERLKTRLSSQFQSSTKQFLPTKPLVDLLLSLPATPSHSHSLTQEQAEALSFSQLRDLLLDYSPLDLPHVSRVNQAEASFWRATLCGEDQGRREEDSTKILGFDCGGEQWVYEVCFPIGSLSQQRALAKQYEARNTSSTLTSSTSTCDPLPVPKDLEFVQRLLEIVEREGIPAASPIEQRWTARSKAFLSPAYSDRKSKPSSSSTSSSPFSPSLQLDLTVDSSSQMNTQKNKEEMREEGFDDEEQEEVFSWVGIIMYLPPHQTPSQREDIRKAFVRYCDHLDPLMKEFKAQVHWAKIELPQSGDYQNQDQDQITSKSASTFTSNSYSEKLHLLKERIHSKYPIDQFHSLRQEVDPKGIMGSPLIDTLLVPSDSLITQTGIKDKTTTTTTTSTN